MDAAAMAREFDLGADARLSDGPVARGRMDLVWRLEIADRRWAVKVAFASATEADAHAAVLQETAWAAGVPARRWEPARALDAWPGVDPRWQPVSAVVALEQVATLLLMAGLMAG